MDPHPPPPVTPSPSRTSTHPPTSPNNHPSPSRDSISIKNLQLSHGIIAPDVWGKPKSQPALLTLTLHLHGPGFSSASTKDELDSSTIHYGELAKRIRSASREGQNAGELASVVEGIVGGMGMKESYHNDDGDEDGDGDGDGDGRWRKFIIARSTIEICLPKASMFGDGGISLINSTNYDVQGKMVNASRIFSVREIKIMTLVGVNSYERTMKQPLVVSLVLHLRPDAQMMVDSSGTVALFNLEQMVVEIINQTAFETLETLASFTILQLRKKMLDATLPGTKVQLRIEKPRAIAFADAPVIEIMREIPYAGGAKRSTRVVSSANTATQRDSYRDSPTGTRSSTAVGGVGGEGTQKSASSGRLSVIKPYDY